jgi:hypothetical protein
MTAHDASIMCDWTTGSHRYREPVKPFEAGKILKIDREGVIEWEKRDWETIRCPSSDTSIRISCDGERLRFMGNIGRFQQSENVQGVGVVACMDKWAEVLTPMGIDLTLFGAVHAKGSPSESGTTLSRIDLAGNFEVDDFKSWCHITMQRRLGRRLPLMGRYGPQWGFEARRSNWWKAKIYDKSAEQAGERGPRSGATLARFEVQLGGEYLKREGLQYVAAWKESDMAQIIYGRFSAELLRDGATVERWDDIPARIRHYAVLWRDGQDVRQMMTRSTYFRVKKQLREHGIDLDIPCNVVALVRRVREVTVRPVDALRVAA